MAGCTAARLDAPAGTARRRPRCPGAHGQCPTSAATRPADHVQRAFTAARPNQLWLVDFTYVSTSRGTCFTAFVSDVFSRRIVRWRTDDAMPTQLLLDALDMALWVRTAAGKDTQGLVHCSDAGSQYTAIRFTERLATPAWWPPSAPSATPTTTRWPSP